MIYMIQKLCQAGLRKQKIVDVNKKWFCKQMIISYIKIL